MNRVSQLVLNLISSNNKELEFMKTWIVPSKVMSSPLVSPWANVFWIQEFLRPLFLQRIHRVDDGPRVSHQVDHVQVVSTDPSLLRQILQYSSHLSHWKADCLDDPEHTAGVRSKVLGDIWGRILEAKTGLKSLIISQIKGWH